MIYLAAAIVAIFALLGVALTLLTLPGIWLMLLVAVLADLWQPELFSTTTLLVAGALAVLAEVAEFAASAAGARRARGSRIAAFASVVGALAGAVVGSFAIPVPILGTIVGGIVGAAVFAGVAELVLVRSHWGHSVRVARGAATGRALSLVAKTTIAVFCALILGVAAFWP